MAGLYPDAEPSSPAPVSPSTETTPESPEAILKSFDIGKGDKAQYDKDPGPTEERECRDVLFLILFAAFWVGFIVIGSLASQYGNIDRLKYGNDTLGNLCGVNNAGGMDHTLAPFQYVFNPFDALSYRRCVSECPDTFGNITCHYGITPPTVGNGTNYYEWLQFYNKYGGNCTLTMKTKEALNRCVPDVSAILAYTSVNATVGANSTTIDYSTSKALAVQIFSDLYSSWRVIMICSVVALVFSFGWLFLVQWFADLMVWFTLGFVNIIGIGFMAFMWFNYNKVRQGNAADPLLAELLKTGKYNEELLLAIAIILTIIVGRSRIRLAIALIQETSKAVKAMPLMVFFPIWKYIAIFALTCWTVYVWIMLVTSGSTVTGKINDKAVENDAPSFESNEVFQMLTIYVALGYYWTYNWIIAIAQTTIAGSIAGWYWTRDKQAISIFPVWNSFKRTMRYHLGSLAFGSLIIAIIETVQLVLTYIQAQLRSQKASQLAKCVVACLQCCVGCLESFMKFLNKNAYIEIAIYGYTFCEGSRTAFSLLVRNAVRVAVVDRVGAFLFFLGKLMITMATCFVGAAMLQPADDSEASKFWAVPLVIIAVSSYAISSCFMAVFDMAVDTMFLCFCEDSERNNGQDKPFYMTDSLKKFMDSHKFEAPKV